MEVVGQNMKAEVCIIWKISNNGSGWSKYESRSMHNMEDIEQWKFIID